jgi:branched-chain amino acid aminotransferase
MIINKTAKSRIESVDLNNVQFGSVFSDHMLVADYENGSWSTPAIMPYQPIDMLPSISAIHYGQAIFEGMKAFKDAQGNPQLFRPFDNFNRFNKSAERMAMPTVPESIFVDGLKELIKLDQSWIPTKEGSALYIRPFMFATDEFVGVRPSKKFKFIIFTCPVNSYYPKPIRVLVEQHYVRAFEGGIGFAKAAGNYGLSMLPTLKAQQKGYDQLIWTDGHEHQYIEESGTMNVFFHIGNKVYTPALSSTILDGITRNSCIALLKDAGYEVVETKLPLSLLFEGLKNNEVADAFGTGTAALIAKIDSITVNDNEYKLPNVQDRKVSNYLYDTLEKIRTSQIADKHNWVVKLN